MTSRANKDYSREGFTARLGADVMAEIRRQVAAAPQLTTQQIDTLRRLAAIAQTRTADETRLAA